VEVRAAITYRRLGRIGVGQGMNSEVFRALDPQLNTEIAVKEIQKALMVNPPPNYYAEAQAMFKNAHPNIVPIQYACETGTHVCLAMPYFQSGSLQDLIETHPVSISRTLRIAQGVLNGLQFIHERQYLHFDLKPSNVFLNQQNVPLIADFGQARVIGSDGVVVRPPMYELAMPPETWVHNVGVVQSDIYQGGLLLYRLVNGDRVFQRQANRLGGTDEIMKATVKGKFPDRNLFLPHVPQRLRSIIRKALRVNPSDRFVSAHEMAVALGRVKFSHDWDVETLGTGYRWTSNGRSQTKVIVELATTSNGKFDASVWTLSQAGLRAKNKNEFWLRGYEFDVAFKHLSAVFESF
jgi:eukaryotic-like serine/threonine-protein kinase